MCNSMARIHNFYILLFSLHKCCAHGTHTIVEPGPNQSECLPPYGGTYRNWLKHDTTDAEQHVSALVPVSGTNHTNNRHPVTAAVHKSCHFCRNMRVNAHEILDLWGTMSLLHHSNKHLWALFTQPHNRHPYRLSFFNKLIQIARKEKNWRKIL